MKSQELKNSAFYIAKNYANKKIRKIDLAFQIEPGVLLARFYVSEKLMDDDKEDCELIVGEIIGEYPEIGRAETIFIENKYSEINTDSDIIISVEMV